GFNIPLQVRSFWVTVLLFNLVFRVFRVFRVCLGIVQFFSQVIKRVIKVTGTFPKDQYNSLTLIVCGIAWIS
ncbi:MAG TPA: hypothetical protein VJ205_04855, partial [Gammaproteobacteria bacterium]|nr:hypothetical protein [Gammaproteobacteria bacterium]